MVGKIKNTLRAVSLFVLLAVLMSIHQPAFASTSSVDQVDMQLVDRTRSEFQRSLQALTGIGVGITPAFISTGEIATVTVNLNNVPAEGYPSVEVTCTYYPDLVEARDIVVGDLFGADPVVAIQGPLSDHFVAAIAGSHGRKATSSGALLTFHVVGLQSGLFPITCEARVSTGDQALTDLAPISNDLHVFSPTSTPKTDFCDSAEFVADVTIPPGTVLSPGQAFTKTWLLTNVGTCTWTQAYELVFDSGTSMSAISPLKFPVSVGPGVTVNISVNMIAPLAAGPYIGNWKFRNANGALFGIGASANEPFSVNIIVSNTSTPSVTVSPSPSASPVPSITPGGPTATPMGGVAYDFTANVCQARWFSGAGPLPCPGIDGNPNGFVLPQDHPVMETGVISPQHGLITVPQNVQNGYIQGFYPPFHVQNGDRFRTTLNCEYGATSCYLAFRLDYQIGSDPIKAFWGPFLERYDGQYYSMDVDLSPLAGKDIKFILTVLSAGSPTGDRALWVGPYIYRSDLVATTTSTPTLTSPSSLCNKAEFVEDVSLPPGTTVLPGQFVGKIWRVKNIGSCPWTPSYGWLLVSGALLNASNYNTFAYTIMPGEEAEVYTSFMAPTVPGHYQSLWKLHDASGTFFGVGASGSDPLVLDIVVSGPTVTPAFDLTPSPSPVPTATVPGDWLIFANMKYAFQFLYPPDGQLQANHTDTYSRINLSIQPGTNLDEKYLEVIVNENASPCQSPLATQSILETTTVVSMNGIPFVKQTGGDSSAGSIDQWEAYSTVLNNVCVSLDFVLHSQNPGLYVPPLLSYDYPAETAVFGQIVSTYRWLPSVTATPSIVSTSIFTDTPSPSTTSAVTATFTPSLTPTPGPTGMLTGQVTSAKPATISVYNANNVLVVSVPVALDGRSFAVTLLGGTYRVVASAPGYLSAQGSFTVTSNQNSTLPTVTLLAGDIDGNNVIDPMDALTIGMNYNGSTPSAADLNSDGLINVLDLELLAENYRDTGPTVWH